MLAGKRPQQSGWLATQPPTGPANETNSRTGWPKQTLGYTIVEVMVVLAISGFMFLIAAQFINGKQQKAAFTAGVNEMATQIQAVAEQVTDGQYSDIGINCTYNDGTTTINDLPSTNAQGTNNQCVFLGKMIHFCPDHSSASACTVSDNKKYSIYTLAGGRLDSNGNPISDVLSADPRIVDDLDISDQQFPQSLQVLSFKALNNAGRVVGFPTDYVWASDIGFFLQNNDVNAATNLPTGAATVNMFFVYPVGGGFGQKYPLTSMNSFNHNPSFPGPPLIPTASADICITDGTEYADIILGTNNNQLSVDVKRDGTTEPATCMT